MCKTPHIFLGRLNLNPFYVLDSSIGLRLDNNPSENNTLEKSRRYVTRQYQIVPGFIPYTGCSRSIVHSPQQSRSPCSCIRWYVSWKSKQLCCKIPTKNTLVAWINHNTKQIIKVPTHIFLIYHLGTDTKFFLREPLKFNFFFFRRDFFRCFYWKKMEIKWEST